MKTENFDGTKEKTVLIALIMDKKVLQRLANVYQKDMFSCPAANRIADWCYDFYSKQKDAPQAHIKHYFDDWASRTKKKEEIDFIGTVLEGLNNEHVKNGSQNSDFMIELLAKHLNHVRAVKTTERLQGELHTGNTKSAWEILQQTKPIDLSDAPDFEPFSNPEQAYREVEADEQESIIKYPGVLGNLFEDIFVKKALVSFVAPEKKGKSVWLLDVAWRAMESRQKVLYIQVGDMSKSQLEKRFFVRACRRPWKPGKILYPLGFEKIGKGDIIVSHEEKVFEDKLTIEAGKKAFEKVRGRQKSKQDLFRIVCYPNLGVTANGIETLIQRYFDKGDFKIGVCVIDYADNLAPITAKYEYRQQINETWSKLSGIRLQYDLCLITATQANAKAYDQHTLDMSNFSESKGKNAHVTANIGINYTEEEKAKGITRLNIMPAREKDFQSQACVYAIGCRAINAPYINDYSTW